MLNAKTARKQAVDRLKRSIHETIEKDVNNGGWNTLVNINEHYIDEIAVWLYMNGYNVKKTSHVLGPNITIHSLHIDWSKPRG